MALLDWLRGRSGGQTEGHKDSETERMDARRAEQGAAATPEEPASTEGGAEERRHEEAARHSGI